MKWRLLANLKGMNHHMGMGGASGPLTAEEIVALLVRLTHPALRRMLECRLARLAHD